ncbi:MAG: argininosuccinate synthase domain-containing protein [Vicinamibacterales bacterium]
MRIVLAFSGGLRPLAAIPWLRATHRADVIAVIVDLGHGRALEAVRDRALAAGAVRAHVVDAREAFARDFVLPSLRADAVPADGLPRPLPLGRPAIGRALVDIARIERAVAVAHGAEPASADAVRLESAVAALDPGLTLLRPAADMARPAEGLREYLRAERVPLPPDPPAGTAAADINVWGRTLVPAARGEGEVGPPPPAALAPQPPVEAAFVEVRFESGTPVALNGVAMPFVELVQTLGAIAGAHGVGRVDLEGLDLDAPAAVALHTAHRALRAGWRDDLRAFHAAVSAAYARLIDEGRWFGPLRSGLDAFVAETQRELSGAIRLKLFQARCEAIAASVPSSR